jgi:hypothetical protein
MARGGSGVCDCVCVTVCVVPTVPAVWLCVVCSAHYTSGVAVVETTGAGHMDTREMWGKQTEGKQWEHGHGVHCTSQPTRTQVIQHVDLLELADHRLDLLDQLPGHERLDALLHLTLHQCKKQGRAIVESWTP